MKSIAIVVLSLGILGGAWAGTADEMYAKVRLTADLAHLSEAQKEMLTLMIEAAKSMDDAFWLQAYGDKYRLLGTIEDNDLRRFAEINYGPWDRLGPSLSRIIAAAAGDLPGQRQRSGLDWTG